MRSIVVSLAAAAVALVAAPAALATELPTDTRSQIEQLANDTAGRCAGHVSVVWAHELDTVRPDLAAQGLEVYGVAYGVADGGCSIAVRSDVDVTLACTVAMHEVAHLNGEQHGDGDPLMGDARGVFGTYRDPRCATVTILSRDDAIDYLWARVSSRTKVACKRSSSSVFVCTTQGRRVRKTWRVQSPRTDVVRGSVIGAVA